MCICLICQTTIAILKKGNFERHYRIFKSQNICIGISLKNTLSVGLYSSY